MKLHFYIFLFPWLLLLFGCEENQESDITSSIPDGVELIDQETFVKILAESQIIESHTTVLRVYQPYYKDSIDNYYKSLYEKYGITTESFYYTMKEYSKDPYLMDTLLSASIDLLKKMENDLGDVKVPNQSLNALSRQQIGDIVFETPIKDLMINATPMMAEIMRDTLFHYLDSMPEIVTSKGYSMESVRFTFVLNTNNKVMFNQLKDYLKNKEDKISGND